MRSLLYALSFMAVIGLAFWAYHENYKTQAVQGDTEDLQRQISHARERLRVLNAEWAYLNRPDRLRELADLNFEKLGLLPFEPHQFGRIDEVAFPKQEPLPILNPVDVSSQEAGQ